MRATALLTSPCKKEPVATPEPLSSALVRDPLTKVATMKSRSNES